MMRLMWGNGLAEAMFESQYIRDRCESVILYSIKGFFERSKGLDEFKRFDYYDSSIELWTCPDNYLTEEEQACLKTLGFERCWICFRETEDGPSIGEKAYYFGDDK